MMVYRLGMVAASLIALASVASAQDTSAPASSPAVAPTPTSVPASAPAASADSVDANAIAEGDPWREISPKELEELIRKAEAARLADERQKAADEIRDGLLYEEEDKDAAVAILQKDAAGTQADNIDRICRAMARVDGRFGKCHKLFADGNHAQAAAALKPLLEVSQASYLSTCKLYLYAASLEKQAQLTAGKAPQAEARQAAFQAIDAYTELIAKVPERISFATAACMQAGRMYEDLGRLLYASQMYGFCLANYGLTLPADQVAAIAKKLSDWRELYNDPMSHLAGSMQEVRKLLEQSDSGKGTQQKEQQIVALLEDLIKTAEEKGNGDKNNQNNKDKKDKNERKSEEEKKAAAGQNQPNSTEKPSSPAAVGALRGGVAARPPKPEDVRNTAENGDWSTLPPRERDRLQQIMNRIMSERHRDLVSDYHSSLAKEQPK